MSLWSWSRIVQTGGGLLVNLGLAAVSAAATLAAVELGARLFVPSATPARAVRNFWAHHERLGWAHEPEVESVHYHPDFEVPVRTNAHGLRDHHYPFERREGQPRMLVLGDSYAFGYGVEHEAIFSERIEARHPDWEIINAGVAGWGTDQQLLFLQETGRRYEPDVVLLLFHSTDRFDNTDDMRYGYHKPLYVLEDGELRLTNVPVPELTDEQKLDRWLYQRTWILYEVYHWKRHARSLWARLRPEPERPQRSRAEEDAEERVRFRLSAALLREMRRVVEEEMGARFVVASVPGRARFDLSAHLTEVLEPMGVPYLPLDEAFAPHDWRDYQFPNDRHWNARGHAIAARAIEAFLVERGVLSPVSAEEGPWQTAGEAPRS